MQSLLWSQALRLFTSIFWVGACCFQSHPVKAACVESSISMWIAEWRPGISRTQAMLYRSHETSTTTPPVFLSLFNGSLY